MDLWYVLLGDKWKLLPEITCRLLTDAETKNKIEACDDQYVYDLKYDERKQKGKEGVKEEIMFIKGNCKNFDIVFSNLVLYVSVHVDIISLKLKIFGGLNFSQ